MRFFGKKAANSLAQDWATDAADTITRVVDSVHDKAIVPLRTIARAIVYGILALVAGTVAIVLVAILSIRIADIYLDNISWMPEGVWVAYLLVGAIFMIFGMFAWSRRLTRSTDHKG